MNRILLAIGILIVTALLSSAQTTGRKTSGGDLRSAIEAANKRFSDAFGKGEAAKVAGMYAEGARAMPPNGPVVQGRQSIQELWQSVINTGAKLSLSTSDVEAQGNVVIEVGTYEMTFPDNKRDAGKYVVVWKREKGVWKLAVDIWNSNMPATGN